MHVHFPQRSEEVALIDLENRGIPGAAMVTEHYKIDKCSHSIVGRYKTGFGGHYGSFDARKIFDTHEGSLALQRSQVRLDIASLQSRLHCLTEDLPHTARRLTPPFRHIWYARHFPKAVKCPWNCPGSHSTVAGFGENFDLKFHGAATGDVNR